MAYEHRDIEKWWQAEWKKRGSYRVENDTTKPKFYALDMFPYPSGAGLHVGHPLGYIASDIVARYKRLCGFNVLHPMGYDAFGLPAEQYAIQTGQHPRVTTEKNIARYREQFDRIGFSFDWSREVRTNDPAYYKWTQWIFLQLFDSWYNPETDKAEPITTLIARFKSEGWKGGAQVLSGNEEEEQDRFTAQEWRDFDDRKQQEILLNFRLAYLSEAWVNWCPALGTVLANDEVKDGVSERGGHRVERKRMPQWSLRITAYAQRLLDDLAPLDWSEAMKEAQRNWIGRSEGASVRFKLKGEKESIEVFTTRPDTLFGVTFVTLAPEHELIEQVTPTERLAEVMAYVAEAKNRSERERLTEVKRVSGVFTGGYAEHPFTGEDIPVWVGDYVLGGYGTGAVMAVPGGDQRDWNFATHFNLPIIAVTEGAEIDKQADERKDATIINSDFLNGMQVPDAIQRAIAELGKLGVGERRINFRLRDAAFGRQRYWGEPIPIYYKDGIPYPLPESELPLVLPEVDKYLPTEDGEPPLARASNWNYKGAPLETTTMPGWAASSWYFLRYMDPHNVDRFASEEAIKYWNQIDLYIGGSEHATGHLLYFRFWTKFLHDRGWLPFDEPAKKLVNQGMIQGVSQKIYLMKSLTNTIQLYNQKGVVISNAPVGSVKQIFVSADVYMSFIKGGITDDYTLVNVPVDLVSDGILDLQEFIHQRPEFGQAVFNTINGNYWVNGEIVELVDGEYRLRQERSPLVMKFRCIPEVEKMSKSKFNVVNPDDIIEKYGADTLRLYEMFLGPLEQSKPWDTNGIEGTSRFLKKFWNLFHEGETFRVSDEPATRDELKVLHATLKKVSEDIEKMSFNTSVSQFMIACNALQELKCNKRAVLEPLTIALAPFAPHIAEELWSLLGHGESITQAIWPKWDAQHLVEDSFSYPISFNGKTRMQLEFSTSLSKEEVEAAVLANPEVQQRLEGQSPKKVIVVPKRIVNIVV